MLGRFGKKHAEIAASFVSSGVGFGTAAMIGMLYFTDWKVIVTKIPFYSGKFTNIKTEE